MEKDRIITVSEAVHKLQLALLDGIEDDGQLFAAGPLMSRSDYGDVVTERTIANLCGYPLCPNSLPAEHPKKGQYRISIKEHRVYDLHETYLYCCSSCLINSKAFAGSLNEERCSILNPAKVNEILSLFKSGGLENEEEEGKGENGDLGLSKLMIKENVETKGGEVSMEEWVGPSNAIEGYVPHRDRLSNSSGSEAFAKGSEPGDAKLNKHSDAISNGSDFEVTVIKSIDGSTGSTEILKNDKNFQPNQSETMEPLLGDLNFTSMIITNDEFTAPKKLEGGSKSVQSEAKKGSVAKKSLSTKGKDSFFGSVDFTSTIITQDEYSVSKLPSSQVKSDLNQMSREFSEKLDLDNLSKESASPGDNDLRRSMDSALIGAGNNLDQNASLAEVYVHQDQNGSASCSTHVKDESHSEKVVHSSLSKGKSALRTSGVKKLARSVTWADEKPNGLSIGNLCEFREFNNAKEGPSTSRSEEAEEEDDSQRFTSAEACAMALIQAAEAVASGQSDADDAVSEAGIVVLPPPKTADEGQHSVRDDALENLATEKLPKTPGNLNRVFDSDNSWFDTSPEGFSLTLSPFALMWDALFSWLTSSSLAYIYGRDESVHEEYMFTNGREYPSKIVLPDGRSPEIKQTLSGCLARALPGLIADLKLPTPLSTLEREVTCLLETMSFMDALPPLRMKQWQVIALLFIDALSVCRIPGLSAYLTSRRILIPKVLSSAQISAEEYEIMKDFVIPLGRVPQFSMQSGG
ncbi:putative RNA polymerase II subunit B1 CTD phosphatase RPAP2 homolog [Chenopodium quinoa]|uniref:RNA polymerase II subunit B1 CTD phosphatase RPAP2 homolog n=1 Tax=Chenopodium quinoa TaxID=63459 RepID=A0A803L4K9_CHEQI|nr:putative RNA polymerase II subunit B1 CTD phosphatase RPAP2 homolog [Chenopodium quinoa]